MTPFGVADHHLLARGVTRQQVERQPAGHDATTARSAARDRASWYTSRRSAAAVVTSFSRASVSSEAGSLRISESATQRPAGRTAWSSGVSQLQPSADACVQQTQRWPSIGCGAPFRGHHRPGRQVQPDVRLARGAAQALECDEAVAHRAGERAHEPYGRTGTYPSYLY